MLRTECEQFGSLIGVAGEKLEPREFWEQRVVDDKTPVKRTVKVQFAGLNGLLIRIAKPVRRIYLCKREFVRQRDALIRRAPLALVKADPPAVCDQQDPKR